MSNITIYAVVEGQTEKIFFDKILTPYLATKNISIIATIIKKPGQSGGDVKFSRARKDISAFLRQRSDTYVTKFIDLYGIKEWPGKDLARVGWVERQRNETRKPYMFSRFPFFGEKREPRIDKW